MNQQRTRRSPARFLAPLALIAAVVAFMMVINNSGGGDSSSSNSGTTATETSSAGGTKSAAKTTVTKAKKAAKKKAAAKTYVVQAGDSFGAIATKTGITVERLQELNPDADSRLLQTGQKLRVK
jgi:LysM repeat protein